MYKYHDPTGGAQMHACQLDFITTCTVYMYMYIQYNVLYMYMYNVCHICR